jgi:hypothetical protein
MRRIALLTVLAALVPAGPAGASFSQDVGSPLPTGVAPYSVASADFDGNGRPDLVAANGDSDPGTMSVFLRGTSGGWTQELGSPYNTQAGADDVATADFNGDGKQDFAVASYSTGTGGTVFLRKADNSGFAQEGGVMAIPNATTVAAGDLNGDHKPDLVYASGTSDTVYFALRNAGNTGFDAPVPLASVGHKEGLAIGDFSGDGKPDIVASNLTSLGDLDLWVQNASGPVGFTNAGPVVIGTQPWRLTAADFNGDGHLDVAAALLSTDKVVVMLGHSNKTLTKEAEYPAGDGAIGIKSGDFNSDGRPDLVIADQIGLRVTVLLRTPDGFVNDASSPIVTGQAATGAAVADFDHDTRPDIAIANRNSNTITVLLNTTPFPPPPPPPDLDKDDDGVQTPLDCDDGNPLIKPGAFDIPGDGINQDCSADGDADYPLPGVKIKYSVLTYPAGYSKFGKLTLAPVKAGDKVVLKCKGRGCTFKKKTFNVKKNKARLSLLKPLKRAKLRKGAVVTMRMTRAGTYGSYARWKIRASDSKFKSLCLRPGNTKPVKCPSA